MFNFVIHFFSSRCSATKESVENFYLFKYLLLLSCRLLCASMEICPICFKCCCCLIWSMSVHLLCSIFLCIVWGNCCTSKISTILGKKNSRVKKIMGKCYRIGLGLAELGSTWVKAQTARLDRTTPFKVRLVWSGFSNLKKKPNRTHYMLAGSGQILSKNRTNLDRAHPYMHL